MGGSESIRGYLINDSFPLKLLYELLSGIQDQYPGIKYSF